MDGNTITIKQDLLHIGSNSVRIEASGYKTQDVAFAYEKANEQNAALSDAVVDKAAQTITFTVENSNGDFLKNLYSVTLTKDGKASSVWTQGVGGSDSVYYSLSDDYTTITLHNVKDPGSYSVSVKANYYDEPLTKEFAVEGKVVQNPVPKMDIQQSVADGIYTIKFFGASNANPDLSTDSQIGTWKTAINKITVNRKEYTPYSAFFGNPSADSSEYNWGYGAGTEKVLILGGSAFKDGKNTVVISADGYEDLTVTVNKTSGGTTTDPTKPSEGEVAVPTVAPNLVKHDSNSFSYEFAFSNTDQAWVSKVTGVQVNSTSCEPVNSVNDVTTGKYFIDVNSGSIYTYWSSFENYPFDIVLSTEKNGNLTLTVNREGYSDPTVSIKKTSSGDSSNSGSSGSTVTAPTKLPTISKGSNMYCTLTFSGAATWLAQDGLTVTVNDSVYQKTGSIYNLDGGGAYYVEDDRISLKIPYEMFTSTTSKLVISDGTTNINLTVTIPDYSSGKPTVSFAE